MCSFQRLRLVPPRVFRRDSVRGPTKEGQAFENSHQATKKRKCTTENQIEVLQGVGILKSTGCSVGKRGRHTEEEDTPRSSTTMSVKLQIWKELSNGDGVGSFDILCSEIDNRDIVMDAVQELVKEGRAMVSDGEVYQID